MKCPECSKQFEFKSVPLEDRVMNKLSTSFICPRCRALLKPDKRFELLSIVSLLMLALGVFSILFKLWLNIGISYPVSVFFSIFGTSMYYINFKNIRLLSSN